MQKYLCYSVDDFGHRQAAMYERDNDGDWYLASDVDEQLQNLATHLRDAMLSEDALKAHIQRQDAKIAELEKALREAVSLLQRARDLDSDFNGYIDDEIDAFTKQHSSLMDRKA